MKYIGLLSSAASGKLGGIVASHNRNGTYFRHHAIPVQPRTAAQKLVRNQLAAFSSAFKSLTASQIQGWNALGATVTLKSKLGTTYNPTGQQLFVSCNKHLANVGITTTLLNPPSIPSIPGITTFTSTPVGNGTTVTSWGLATTPNLSTSYAVQVRATATQSNGRSFTGKSQYRNVWGVNPSPTQPTNTTIFTDYIARFGPLPASGLVAFELRYVDPVSGFAGTPVSCTASYTQSSAGVSFALTIGSQTGSLVNGTAGSVTFTVTPGSLTPSGFVGAISYSVTGTPADCTAGFTLNPETAANPTTLTVTGGTTTVAGSYTLTVTGSYGSFSTSQNCTLVIS